jgi:N-hydroxyarylamine O-acetyltransferase
MLHQMMNVPFENLDVLNGADISLQPERIVDKIIGRQRGGYCFELNGLFAMALQSLNIPFRLVSARPTLYPQPRPRTHMAIVAELNGNQWLCDTGFGRYGIRKPVNLNQHDRDIYQGDDCFRLSLSAPGIYGLSALTNDEWCPQFEFDLCPQHWIDFEPANHYTSTHPDSIFINQRIVLRFTTEGRKLLNNNVLKTIQRGETTTEQIAEEHIARILRDEFGLTDIKAGSD